MPRKKKMPAPAALTPEQEVEAIAPETPDVEPTADEVFEAEREVAKALGEVDPIELPTFSDAAFHKWTHEELKRVRHLGPAIIGEEMYRAAQVFEKETKGGIFGPALLTN